MSFVVIATWTARDDEAENVRELLESLAAASRDEPGCLAYEVNRSLDDGRVFVIYERYASRGDYERHAASDHFRRFALEGGIPRLEKRERQFLERVA